MAPDDFLPWIEHHERRSIGSPGASQGAPLPPPADEAKRLAAVRSYGILDTAYEAIFNDIVAAAARICGTPMSAITVVDADRQWFKSEIGLGLRQTARELSFCAHAILEPDQVMVVGDAAADNRFADNPLVTGDPSIRFYAGAPLVTPEGVAVGSMCVLDRVPRALGDEQLEALRLLSDQVIALLEGRRLLADLAERF